MNIYLDLFLTFAKVGVCTFGGGYAMLPILQREVVEKKGWATDEELTDYFAVGQCTPGIIAVNTATFIGYKHRGIPGGVLTTLGVVFPSLVIITAIAAFLSNFADIPVVQHALAGINAAVVALIASSVLKLGKSTLKNGAAIAIFLCVLALSAAGSLVSFGAGAYGTVMDSLTSPVVLIVLAGVVGYLLYGGKKGGEGK
ncbi:chromate transporter [Colidextribacter sp. OB.20]|uniref:chromate transporter n=1 Tax=Colidextribacter sp. OB.20 TaxID=2304568 RepID=UPI00136FED7D|nr:chromate transporter [Colidextribacter sp. OB.20]NBI11448.1 chromate transporter [Colidextribacter sp. OB.20]